MGFHFLSLPSMPNKIIQVGFSFFCSHRTMFILITNRSFQASMNPSDCWAFAGSKAQVVLKLSLPIYIRSFSVEHISRSTPTNFDSVPKGFRVHGMKDAANDTACLLGVYQYERDGESSQSFPSKVRTFVVRIHDKVHKVAHSGTAFDWCFKRCDWNLCHFNSILIILCVYMYICT